MIAISVSRENNFKKKNPLKSGFIEFEIKNQIEIKKNLSDLMLFE